MSERVKLADATLASGPAGGDNIIIERNGAVMRVSEVTSAAQATADGDGNDIASTYARRKVGTSSLWYGSSSATAGWGKVAGRTFTTGAQPSNPYYATFKVTRCSNTSSNEIGSGTLTIRIATNSSTSEGGPINSARIMWGEVTGGIALPGACLAWGPDATTAEVSLWLYTPNSYGTTTAVLLNAVDYKGSEDMANWEMYDVSLSGGETVPDGLTVVEATVGTLQNGVATTSLSGIQSLSGGGGTIADTDLLLVKTESGLTGVTLAELKELLKD